MSATREYRIQLDGVTSRAIELEGTGPPILLLHGFSDSADTWRPVLERLGRSGRRAVAIDLPGFGRADPVDARAPILPQFDRAVAAALRRFPKASRPVVVGNSLGGLAALRAAQDPALGVGAVIPIAPAGLTFARWLQIIEGTPQVQLLLTGGLMLSPLPFVRPVFRFLVGQAYRNLVFSTPSAADPRVVAGYCDNVGGRADVLRMLAMARRALPELADAYELSRITCEVLVIWGSRDGLVPSIGAQVLSEQIPHARITILEGCGHCPQVESPDHTARAIDEIAARFAPSGAAGTSRRASGEGGGGAWR